MIDSIEFAKYIIIRTQNHNPTVPLGETKLHKLLYICNGFILAAGINFIRENARAWNYGPVYPRVHTWITRNPDVFNVPKPCSQEALQEIEAMEAEPLVDRVISVYGVKTTQWLSAWSHRPGSPWELALKHSMGLMNSPINKKDMRDYFKGLLDG
jgi:uncharacterized phage-associated protein